MPGTSKPSDYVLISRTFRDLSDEEVADIEKASALARMGWSRGLGWEEVLRSPRVLLISEAGVGKTRECQAQKDRLLAAGEHAFFFDLATLAQVAPRDTLSDEDERRFDAWLASQSDVATFFLDSIDELKLTLGNFELALVRFAKALGGQIARARIVITTRPVPFDRALIERHLPIPSSAQTVPTASDLADMMVERDGRTTDDEDPKKPKAWRNVGLMPLSKEQQRLFVIGQGVSNPDALLADIQSRDAEEFAERPQDLIELCADWRDHHRIRTHREQVEANIATKLKPRVDRAERAELSQEAAIDGASRLALAAMLTRKLTLRYSAESDQVPASEPALDVSKVLIDWDAAAQSTLLERPLFGFASYGRVRFHHRSVVEFLAAKRMDVLLARGASIKATKRVLFTETAQGLKVVRPSMRPVAAWLASWHPTVFDDIVRLEPAVALDYGDPQSLSIAQRTRALEAYVDRYGAGGWRGLQTPSIQVHRFAAPELSHSVIQLWERGIENEEVRELLLRLITAGKMTGCADLAYTTAIKSDGSRHERLLGIEALLQIADSRLDAISVSLASDASLWPPNVARSAMLRLFPSHMPIERLKSVMQRVHDKRNSIGDYAYYLCETIAHVSLAPSYLDGLRQALTEIVSESVTWEDSHPHVQTRRRDIIPVLVGVCCRQAAEGVNSDEWVRSSLLAVRLSKREYDDEKPVAKLRHALSEMSPAMRETGFWHEVALLEGMRSSENAYNRVFELTHEKGIVLNDAKDAAWVRRRLADPAESLKHREMMLWAEMVFLHSNCTDYRALLESLKPHIADAPSLIGIVEERLKPREENQRHQEWERERIRREKKDERKKEKAHASWMAFWQEIARDPEAVFHPDRAENTAWNLWRAMERAGKESRATGWDRRLIEQQFGKPVADKLRETMMAGWRKDRPTLTSERPEDKKNVYLVRWQFGVAGITAEAEDTDWAKRLTEQDAELACRYAPIHLSGFPPWMNSLAIQHPAAIDRVLGSELTLFLESPDGNGFGVTLQDVAYSAPVLATLFVPRVRGWLAGLGTGGVVSNHPQTEHRLRHAIDILIKHGSDDDRRFVEAEANRHLTDRQDTADLWLSALLYLNPTAGVGVMEHRLGNAAVSQNGAGVALFARLFDGDRRKSINVGGPEFSPPLLLRLLRLAYQHIRIVDDAHHEGSYTPDMRDHAEQARNAVLGALFAASGVEGWATKLTMMDDPLFAHLKDRTLAVATEKAAEEADSNALTESEVAVLNKVGEAPPSTRDAMFALMRDRLDDLDDLLLQDISPREAWAAIKDERVMRRELARALRETAKGAYNLDQEAVTADEKETDIRLRSTVSSQQATIELKLADGRSGRDLFDTLRNQLLTKYMASDDCRAGCLLVTIACDRQWQHPATGKNIDFSELVAVLNEEAAKISRELGGMAKLMAKGLDLRPRLGREH